MPSYTACRAIHGFLLATVLGGCYHYRIPGPSESELSKGRSILVSFDAPSPIQFDLPGVERGGVQIVRQIDGPLVRLSSDSVTLEARTVRDSTGAVLIAPRALVTLARARVATIEVRSFDPETTVRAAIFAGAVLVFVGGLVWKLAHMFET